MIHAVPTPLRLAFSLLLGLAASAALPSAHAAGVEIREQDGRLRIEIGGRLFSEYHYQNVSRPFLYPILGPGDAPMTRNWPMKEVAGEEKDHPHHRSLWWAHGAVNGVDFWSEAANAGKTVHDKFLEIKSGPDAGVIRTANKLIAKDGTLVATSEQTIRILNRTDDRIIDFEVTVFASQGPDRKSVV